MSKVIMIQGTMSSAGKSLITAGLCRIFSQDGFRAAPFKSQNMALNSYITSEGLEMGRAQVMQAEAAGTEPCVCMNPILLKPTSDVGSQVIVNGEVRGNMPASEYFEYKKQLIPDIMNAFHELEKKYDIIVVEGAGSPAEINLKSDDIVNMGLARMLHAPVLLVGDIDRGGVFAQLAGTMLLLEPEEQRMVKGLIINKFRGDETLLYPGIELLKKYTPVPVIGIVPYANVGLDDEDSLAERLENRGLDSGAETADIAEAGLIDIAVIRFPHLSNFTDFNVLSEIAGVRLRYADRVTKLGVPDMVILPGTKNTMGDLKWLRTSGLEAAVIKLASSGTPVMGICGGFQMLGTGLEDPYNIEEGGFMRGMGLLPVRTVFERSKVRTRVRGEVRHQEGIWKGLSGARFEGYEIHMGNTICGEGSAARFAGVYEINDGDGFSQKNSREESADGFCLGNVCGTYVHGIFDSEEMQQALTGMICLRKGISGYESGSVNVKSYKEREYNRLADTVRSALDMDMIYSILDGKQ